MLNPAGDSPERVTCLSTSITKSMNEQLRKEWKRWGKGEEHREQGVRVVTEKWAKPGKTGSGFHEKGCLGYDVGGDKLRSLLQEHQRNTVSFYFQMTLTYSIFWNKLSPFEQGVI